MKPMGQKPSRFPSKTDSHPGKGFVNWWEAEMGNDENKAAHRRQGKRDAAQGLAELAELAECLPPAKTE